MCCFAAHDLDEHLDLRMRCLTVFHRYNVDINHMNPRTLWAPIHWVSNYGDIKSATFLLQQDAIIFRPDHEGFYPMDLAGRNNYSKVTKLLVEYMT